MIPDNVKKAKLAIEDCKRRLLSPPKRHRRGEVEKSGGWSHLRDEMEIEYQVRLKKWRDAIENLIIYGEWVLESYKGEMIEH